VWPKSRNSFESICDHPTVVYVQGLRGRIPLLAVKFIRCITNALYLPTATRTRLLGFSAYRLYVIGQAGAISLLVTGPSLRDIRSQIVFHSLQTGADLYSAFAVQRILEGLGSNRLGMSFSGTGRGCEFAQKAAKSAEKCELKYRLLTIRDLLAEKGEFEQLT
jgi:hypothetical protein